jgi:hypothetical protein
MNTADYTTDSICRSLGLPGFEAGPLLRDADAALRLLLQPSFHPEVCVTFSIVPGRETIDVCAARRMIWHLPHPTLVSTDSQQCEVRLGELSALLLQFASSTTGFAGPGIMIDGMPVDAVQFQAGSPVHRVKHNVAASSPFGTFVARALDLAWNSISNAHCKNAIASAAEYANLDLPRTEEPERKPVVKTMVLGSPEDRHQLLEALRTRGDA